jgi:NADH:ubiquinone oxidoreductase subunit 5 (subunit L)/multisubunit Na+/H+ antiporter MnhA subunit
MTGPLIILALGSFLFWLCISPYTASMAFSLPAGYLVTHMSLATVVHHAFTSPIIWVTAAIIVTLIILTSKWRATVINAYQKPSALTLPLFRAYWIDIFYNRVIVKGLFSFCQQFRRLQTGDLNYNNLAIAIGLVIFLIMLFAWGVY